MASPSTSTSGMTTTSSSSSSSSSSSGFVGTPFATDPRFDYPFPPTAASHDSDPNLNDRPARSHSHSITSQTHPSGSSSLHPPTYSHSSVHHPSTTSPKVLRTLVENPPPIPPRLLSLDLDEVLMARRCCEEAIATSTNSRGQQYACGGRFRAASSKS